jgi:hypothetical protein
MMKDIKSMTLTELTEELSALGEASFRGKQIYTWLHRGVTDFEQMSNLSKPLRQKLAEQQHLFFVKILRNLVHNGTGWAPMKSRLRPVRDIVGTEQGDSKLDIDLGNRKTLTTLRYRAGQGDVLEIQP